MTDLYSILPYIMPSTINHNIIVVNCSGKTTPIRKNFLPNSSEMI